MGGGRGRSVGTGQVSTGLTGPPAGVTKAG